MKEGLTIDDNVVVAKCAVPCLQVNTSRSAFDVSASAACTASAPGKAHCSSELQGNSSPVMQEAQLRGGVIPGSAGWVW